MENTINNIINNKRNFAYILLGIISIALLLGTALGIVISSNISPSSSGNALDPNSNTSSRLNQMDAEINKLKLDLENSNIEAQELTLKLTQTDENYQNVLSDLIESQTDLALKELTDKSSGNANLGPELYEELNRMEKHRLLLVEIRKDPPLVREDAIEHWIKIKTVASRANPSLSSPADKIMITIDNYFDWKDRNPSASGTSGELAYWIDDYELSGASGYDKAILSFTEEALLAVISHMDSISESLAGY